MEKHYIKKLYIVFTIFICHCFIDQDKDDDKAFIFTLKNPHRVDPTRFMKKKGKNAIRCNTLYGPKFGCNDKVCDIYISNKCNINEGFINNDSSNSSYECDNNYRKSLFVGTAGPDQQNKFSVSDYEVFTYN